MHEPHLLREGLIARTFRGRTATDLARRVLLEGAVVDRAGGEPAGRQSV